MILTPEQAYAVVSNLREPERTLTLLAAGTGLRISECLGLQWHDVNFADGMIHLRRTKGWNGLLVRDTQAGLRFQLFGVELCSLLPQD